MILFIRFISPIDSVYWSSGDNICKQGMCSERIIDLMVGSTLRAMEAQLIIQRSAASNQFDYCPNGIDCICHGIGHEQLFCDKCHDRDTHRDGAISREQLGHPMDIRDGEMIGMGRHILCYASKQHRYTGTH